MLVVTIIFCTRIILKVDINKFNYNLVVEGYNEIKKKWLHSLSVVSFLFCLYFAMSENSLFLLSQNKQIKLWHDKSTNKISHPHSFCRNIFYCGVLDAPFIISAVIRMRFRKLLYCNACNGYHWPVSMTF